MPEIRLSKTGKAAKYVSEFLNEHLQSNGILMPKSKIKSVKNCNEQIAAQKFSPVEQARQLQKNMHQHILEIGAALEIKFNENKRDEISQFLNQRREMIKKRIDDQFKKAVVCIQSEVKVENEKKMTNFKNIIKETLNKAVEATTINVKHKHEENIKQYIIEKKNMMWAKIEKLSIQQENYLNQIFDSFKKQSLVDAKENYRNLIMSYRLEFKNQLADVKKEHKKNYKSIENSLKINYREAFDSAKIKLQMKLLQKKPKSVSELSVKRDDKMDRKITESFLKQKTEKLEMLSQKHQELTFCKNKIKSVLSNYSQLLIITENLSSSENYILDKNKIFEKYLSRPTAMELKQLIQDEELP